ncbi:SETD3, partial [Symbiodinium pilosum]
FGMDANAAVMGYDVPLSSMNFPEEEQCKLVAEDWKKISARSQALKKNVRKDAEDAQVTVPGKQTPTKGRRFSFFGSKGAKEAKSTGSTAMEKAEDKQEQPEKTMGAMDFNELVTINAGIISTN